MWNRFETRAWFLGPAFALAALGACEPASRNLDQDPRPAASCQTSADCVLATVPQGCAEGTCVSGQCRFKARDADGDSFRASNCVASDGTAIELGTDCDDTHADVNPSAVETCNGRDDNCNSIVDDGIDPQGTCQVGVGMCVRTGKYECKNGTFSKCNATPGTPQPDFLRCDGKDYACDGPKQVGCNCTVGSTTSGSGPTAGWDWCARNCDTIRRDCTAGRLSPACVATEGEQPRPYCKDKDGDGYYDPNDCQSFCTTVSKPSGAPAPNVGTAPGGYLIADSVHADTNDGNPAYHPGAVDTCTEDRNGNGKIDVTPAGAQISCSSETCGYEATKTLGTNCAFGACTLTGNGAASATNLEQIWQASWSHQEGHREGDGWKVDNSGASNYPIFGPYRALPEGDYTVTFVGTHWTSSTWLDVNDSDGGPVPPPIHLEQGWGAKDFRESISFHAQPCHHYEFRVHCNHYWAAFYGIQVKSITLSRS